MKRIVTSLLLVFACLVLVSGCENKEVDEPIDNGATTPVFKLAAEFENIVNEDKNLESIATKLSKSSAIDGIDVEVREVTKEQYLSGLTGVPSGIKKAYVIAPYINSIPFIAYLFEADDVDALMEELNEKADLRWNICTEADEKVVDLAEGIVFFAMGPSTFEE